MKFSIIMPTFNRGFIIQRAIDSVIKQTYPEWELIIVDDGSSDDTKKVIAEYLKNTKIKFISYTQNRGVNYARNKGIDNSTGEIITFLDSDDEFVPDALGRAKRFIEMNKDTHLFLFSTQTNTGKKTSYAAEKEFKVVFEDYIKEDKVRGEFLNVVRRDVFQNVRFPEDVSGFEGIIWMDIVKRYKTMCIDEVLRIYWQDCISIIRCDTLTRKKLMNDNKGLGIIIDIYENDLKKYNPKKYALTLSILGRNEILLGNKKKGLFNTLNSMKYNMFELRNYRNILYLLKYSFANAKIN